MKNDGRRAAVGTVRQNPALVDRMCIGRKAGSNLIPVAALLLGCHRGGLAIEKGVGVHDCAVRGQMNDRVHRRFDAVDGRHLSASGSWWQVPGMPEKVDAAPLTADRAVGVAEEDVANGEIAYRFGKSSRLPELDGIHQPMLDVEGRVVHEEIDG